MQVGAQHRGMTPFLPLAATEVVAVTRRAVSGAHACDEVEPARRGAPSTAREPDRRRPRRLARLAWLLPALDR
jgi:hypothetical protein